MFVRERYNMICMRILVNSKSKWRLKETKALQAFHSKTKLASKPQTDLTFFLLNDERAKTRDKRQYKGADNVSTWNWENQDEPPAKGHLSWQPDGPHPGKSRDSSIRRLSFSPDEQWSRSRCPSSYIDLVSADRWWITDDRSMDKPISNMDPRIK